ncbi:hypothetical protein ACFL5Y_03625 [Candidatus Omnitrophota bacterium]
MFIFAAFFIICVVLGYGIFLLVKPALTIELQQKFYEKINWRMEPISIKKEIRNTQIMGVFLIALVILAVVYILSGGL